MIEAAKAFVPVAIYNNAKGKDAQVLKRFKERSWNNPVVRFVNAEGKDLIPRKGGVYRRDALLARMAQALKAAGKPVPEALQKALSAKP